MSPSRGVFATPRGLPIVGLTVALVVLLVALAVLQYRWIGAVSRAERERLESSLETAARRFVDDVDRELTRALVIFQFGPPGRRPGPVADSTDPDEPLEASIARRVDRWEATADRPGLIESVWLVSGRGGVAPPRRFDFVDGTLETSPADRLPDRLEAVSASLAATPEGRPSALLDAPLSALAVPLHERPRGPFPGGPRPSGLRGPDPAARPLDGWLVLLLSEAVLRQEMLSDLARLHFGLADDHPFELRITEAQTGRALFDTTQGDHPAAAEPDLELDLFTFRPYPDLMSRRLRPTPPPEEGEERPEPSLGFAYRDGQWRLQAWHREGSLDRAVAHTRTRNLAISLGIVALLGASVLLLAHSTRRAQRLARHQLDFVAGLSHELHTPLAAIRSAGQNLVDGVVREPEKVRRYGQLLVREGQRLSNLVGQALELAGLESGRPRRRERIDLASLLGTVAAETEWLQQEYGVAVETDLPVDLPAVEGEPESLSRAFHNLLTNAIKYSAAPAGAPSPQPVVLRARAVDGRVEVVVEDRGPGIPAEERRHVFEPFYRGRVAAERTVPGSGLGLSLVQGVVSRHRGRIEVASDASGSRFTVELPTDDAPPGART